MTFCTAFPSDVLAPDDAEFWRDFVDFAIKALQAGRNDLLVPSNWAEFLASIRTHPTEPDISVELYHRMLEIKSDSKIDSAWHDVQFEIEAPVRDKRRRGKRSKRADFVFRHKANFSPKCFFIVEAKSLRIPSDVKNKYLSDEGYGCFFSKDSPYSLAPVAGMLAYVFKAPGDWSSEIEAGLKSLLKPAPILVPVNKPNELDMHVHSIGDRSHLKMDPLAIMHVIFEFPSSKGRRKTRESSK